MAIYTFETGMRIPAKELDPVIRDFEHLGGEISDLTQLRDYASVSPSFTVGGGMKLGELAPTHLTDTDLAGVLFVSDSDDDIARYNSLLLRNGVVNPRIPILSFKNHIIAARRADRRSPFVATHLVSDRNPAPGNQRAQTAFNELTRFRFIEEARFTAENVFAVAAKFRKQHN